MLPMKLAEEIFDLSLVRFTALRRGPGTAMYRIRALTASALSP